MRQYIGGVPVDVCYQTDILESIQAAVASRSPLRIHTVNVDHVVLASKDQVFRRAILTAAISVPDGMPIVWELHRRGFRVPRVTGVDLASVLLHTMPVRVVVVGGLLGVADAVADRCALEGWPARVVGTFSPSRVEIFSEAYSEELVSELNALDADVLLVALGSPLQEVWLQRYEDLITIPVRLGIGAGIDFISGRIARAPRIIQKWGLEWLYRMLKDPVRLGRRYLGRDWRYFVLLLRYGNLPAFDLADPAFRGNATVFEVNAGRGRLEK